VRHSTRHSEGTARVHSNTPIIAPTPLIPAMSAASAATSAPALASRAAIRRTRVPTGGFKSNNDKTGAVRAYPLRRCHRSARHPSTVVAGLHNTSFDARRATVGHGYVVGCNSTAETMGDVCQNIGILLASSQDARHEGSKYVSATSRAVSAWPYAADDPDRPPAPYYPNDLGVHALVWAGGW
jgi:hypothetical protein